MQEYITIITISADMWLYMVQKQLRLMAVYNFIILYESWFVTTLLLQILVIYDSTTASVIGCLNFINLNESWPHCSADIGYIWFNHSFGIWWYLSTYRSIYYDYIALLWLIVCDYIYHSLILYEVIWLTHINIPRQLEGLVLNFVNHMVLSFGDCIINI